MNRTSALAGLVFAIVVGCDKGDDDSADTSTPSDGLEISCDELDAQALESACQAAADEAACTVAGDPFDPCAQCVWTDWVPTSIDASMACTFGAVAASCESEVLGNDVGCLVAQSPCGHENTLFREGAGGVEILVSNQCTPRPDEALCNIGSDGTVLDGGPPECTCACDPAFPGL